MQIVNIGHSPSAFWLLISCRLRGRIPSRTHNVRATLGDFQALYPLLGACAERHRKFSSHRSRTAGWAQAKLWIAVVLVYTDNAQKQQVQTELDKVQIKISHKRQRVVDLDIIQRSLQDFESLVNLLPLEDQKELMQLPIKEIVVSPYDPDDEKAPPKKGLSQLKSELIIIRSTSNCTKSPIWRALLTVRSKVRIIQPIGSPDEVVGRTHRAVFRLRKPRRSPKRQRRSPSKQLRNPIQLALEWQNALETGQITSKTQLAASLGLSRARVTQMLRLLKLAPAAQTMILSLGDPLPVPIVTERMLRGIVGLRWHQQNARVARILAGKARGGAPGQ